jgi:hypothetical protein
MAKNEPVPQHIIDSLVYYNAKYHLAICKPCASVFPKNVATHLRDHHNVFSLSERAAIVKYINMLHIRELDDIMKEVSSKTEIDAIEGLPIYENIVRCQSCQKLGAESTIIVHCRNEHNWTTVQGMYAIYLANNCSNMGKANGTDTSTSTKPSQIFSCTENAFKLPEQ